MKQKSLLNVIVTGIFAGIVLLFLDSLLGIYVKHSTPDKFTRLEAFYYNYHFYFHKLTRPLKKLYAPARQEMRHEQDRLDEIRKHLEEMQVDNEN